MKTLMTLMLLAAVMTAPAVLAGTAPEVADTDHAIRDQGRRALAEINNELRENLRPARPELALRHAVHGVRVVAAAAADAANTASVGI